MADQILWLPSLSLTRSDIAYQIAIKQHFKRTIAESAPHIIASNSLLWRIPIHHTSATFTTMSVFASNPNIKTYLNSCLTQPLTLTQTVPNLSPNAKWSDMVLSLCLQLCILTLYLLHHRYRSFFIYNILDSLQLHHWGLKNSKINFKTYHFMMQCKATYNLRL